MVEMDCESGSETIWIPWYSASASILAANNRPLVNIQQMLRHGSITTTARYIHTLDGGNREVLSALPALEDRELKRG